MSNGARSLVWPGGPLPGVCARTGAATRQGVVLRVRGAGDVTVPLSPAVRLRWRALNRIRLLSGLVGLALVGLAASGRPWLGLGAAAALAVAGYATVALRAVTVRVRRRSDGLELRRAHPALATAVAAMPARRCNGGGCATCVLGCLPQVHAV